MQYTEQLENTLYSSWDDTGTEDYQNVLNVLQTDFRSFGEGLFDILSKKAKEEIINPVECLKAMCIEEDIDVSDIGSANSLKSWFSGGPRPKKGDDSRDKMFALAFALKLTAAETADLFHKVYLDRAFNQRNYKELIYYYCINHQLSFSHAKELISKVEFNQTSDDKTVYTANLIEETSVLNDEAALIAYINSHAHNFAINTKSAKAELKNQREKALHFAQLEADSAWDQSLYHGVNRASDNFLYDVITERTVSGNKGTVTLPFKTTDLPKEIKNNFPQVKSLSDNVDSYEELRKAIILLFSYSFWRSATTLQGEYGSIAAADFFDFYIDQLNDLLIRANLPELYYGNPYDWMFLYCTYADNPLDSFRGIISAVLDKEEE